VNKFLSFLLACAMALGSLNAEAARRLGGGKSIGQQSGNVTQREAVRPQAPVAPSQQAAPSQVNKPAPAPVAAAPKKPWGAMLGGLAAGLGLAWLAHSLGFGEAFGNVMMALLIGMVVLAVIGMVLRRRAPAGPQMAYQGAGRSADQPASFRQYNPEKVGNDASARPWESQSTHFDSSAPAQSGSMIGAGLRGGALSGAQGWGIPAEFDVAGFVEAAKRNFITLQDAWDRSDMALLRSMMTDTMVAEIRSQLAEREVQFPGQANKTEVIMLEAQLLGIEDLPDGYMASVEFNGMIREDASAGPSPFREVWNMTKPKAGGSGWLVAGVQALQ
jgi:predicted lipid-binding transport protein (Tim44 family)